MKLNLKSDVLTFKRIMVDREIAEHFLANHKEHQKGVAGTNRQASKMKIEEYSLSMVADEWYETHQGVAFTPGGIMFDGQHRMKAVIAADKMRPGIKVPFVVAFGANPETYKVIDSGMRRRLADVLSGQGIGSSTQMASALKLLFCYEHVKYYGTASWHKPRGFTPDSMEKLLSDWPEMYEGLVRSRTLSRIANQTAMTTAYALVSRYRPDADIDGFFSRLVTGTGEGWQKGDPVYELRETLIRRPKSASKASDRVIHLALFIKAWNRFTAGEEIRLLRFGTDESFPRIAVAEVGV